MKETQENELLSLIRHVNIYPNKVLIMNSRVTIFQEAQARTPTLIKSLDRNEYGAYVLNMDNISFVDKSRIFYNHLFFYHVPELYREDVIRHKNYWKIVKHRNFNPRIIEFVCSPRQWENITPYGFSKFILQCLDSEDFQRSAPPDGRSGGTCPPRLRRRSPGMAGYFRSGQRRNQSRLCCERRGIKKQWVRCAGEMRKGPAINTSAKASASLIHRLPKRDFSSAA